MCNSENTLHFDMPSTLNAEQTEEFIKRLGYLSENINNVTVDDNKIIIHLDQVGLNKKEEIKKLIYDLEIIVKNLKVLSPKVKKNNLDGSKNPLDFSNHLSSINLELLRELDNLFLKIALEEGAVEKDYPLILDKENMFRNRYHLEFPQNIYAVFEVPHEKNILDKIKPNNDWIENNLFTHKQEYLRPCICYGTYNDLSDKVYNENYIYTAKGKCFRNEIDWKLDNYRKKEFYMREIIFVGSEEFVLNLRRKIINKVWDIFEMLGLKGKIETASDPFYSSENFKRGTYQKMSDSKYELLALCGENNQFTSITSFNFCGNTICKSYNIKNNENVYLYSGCVAFGLDRWVELLNNVYGENAIYKITNELHGILN